MLTSIPWYVFLKCLVWLRIKILLNLLLASTTAIQLAAWSGLPSLFLMRSLSVLKAVPRKHPGNDGFYVSNSNTSCVIFKCINREIYLPYLLHLCKKGWCFTKNVLCFIWMLGVCCKECNAKCCFLVHPLGRSFTAHIKSESNVHLQLETHHSPLSNLNKWILLHTLESSTSCMLCLDFSFKQETSFSLTLAVCKICTFVDSDCIK